MRLINRQAPACVRGTKHSTWAVHFKDFIVKFNEELSKGLVCNEPRGRNSFMSSAAFNVVGTLGYIPLLQTNNNDL